MPIFNPPSLPLMYSFCSSIVISGFRSIRVFPGYFPQFQQKVSGGYGVESNSAISSVLFCEIPIFYSAAK